MSVIFNWIISLINNFFNFVIKLLANTIGLVADMLPDFSLFDSAQMHNLTVFDGGTDVFGMFNWFVDVGAIIQITALIWGAYALFFVFSVILRWLKVIN